METRNMRGGRTPLLLVSAFNFLTEFPHQGGEPGVVWVAVVSIGKGAGDVEGLVDGMGSTHNHSINLLLRD